MNSVRRSIHFQAKPSLPPREHGFSSPATGSIRCRFTLPSMGMEWVAFVGQAHSTHPHRYRRLLGSGNSIAPNTINIVMLNGFVYFPRYNPYTQQTNTYRSPMSSPPRTKRETPPRLPSKKQRSQSLTPIQGAQAAQQRYCSADGVIQSNGSDRSSKTLSKPSRLTGSTEKCNSADGVIHNNDSTRSTEEKCSSADGVVKTQTLTRSGASSQSLPRSNSLRSSHGILGSRTSSINKEPSEHSLSPCLEQKQFAEDEEESEQPPSPPPKPGRGVHRNESMKDADPHGAMHRMGSYHPSGSDSGNGSGDSAQSSAAGEEVVVQHRGGVILKNPRFIPTSMSSITLRSYADFDPLAAEEALFSMNIPTFEQVSRYDLENYNTLLLPFCDYKPLDSGTLNTFRMMLSETSSRVIAAHLTRVDISLILGA